MSGITITHHLEFEVTVEGDYDPGEEQTYWNPGHAEDAHVTAVYLRVPHEDRAQGRKWVEKILIPESMWGEQEGDMAEALIIAARDRDEAAREDAAERRAEDLAEDRRAGL